ncbi:MAG: hypothetical protein ACKVQW_05210 [Pyrinomonadaceae bacterium]
MNAYIRRNPRAGKHCRQWFIRMNHTIGTPGARAPWEGRRPRRVTTEEETQTTGVMSQDRRPSR